MDLTQQVVETGLTATVNQPPVPLPGLNVQQLSALALEVAMDIRELKDILPDYKLNQAQYDRLLTHPVYEKTLQVLTAEWRSASSTNQRIKLEAAAILEKGMIALGTRMMNKDESFAAAIEAGKLFKTLAGIGEQDRGTGPGDKFTITINLGADAKVTRTLDITPRAEASGEPALVREEPRAVDSKGPSVSANAEG